MTTPTSISSGRVGVSDWIILRTSGRFTLTLAKTLAEDGFDVWTPAKTEMIRVPRKNARREVRLPLTPSFIFARAEHLVDLLQLAKMVVKPRAGWKNGYRRDKEDEQPPHHDFSVFHWGDNIPMIHDAALEALRAEEGRAIPKRKRSPFGPNEVVKVTKGSFAGMTGVIERTNGKESEVWLTMFGRHFRTKIPTFLLKADQVCKANIPAAKRAA